MRFRLVDRIDEWHPGERARGVAASAAAAGLAGPGRPDGLPRPLLIEAVAQLASYMLGAGEAAAGRQTLALLTGVAQWRHGADARPGDVLHLEATVIARAPEGARVAGEVRGPLGIVAAGQLHFTFATPDDDAQLADFAWTASMLRNLVRA